MPVLIVLLTQTRAMALTLHAEEVSPSLLFAVVSVCRPYEQDALGRGLA